MCIPPQKRVTMEKKKAMRSWSGVTVVVVAGVAGAAEVIAR